MKITHIKETNIYLDGEFVGTANVIIEDRHGRFYGVEMGKGEADKLQDNGEYVFVDGFGVEAK